jgi:NADH dehydrogenase
VRCRDILVVGGAGFVGRHVVAALAARGLRVTVPTRRRERARHLILLPTVDVVQTDVGRPGVLERLADGCDAVVFLPGVLHSRRGRADERGPNDYGPDFARVHVELAQAVVNACHTAGVQRLLHMSALGAAPGRRTGGDFDSERARVGELLHGGAGARRSGRRSTVPLECGALRQPAGVG